jgi:hypothetical protein
MRNPLGILALLVAATPSVASGQDVQQSAACVENGTQIRVVAFRFAEDPPAYAFRVVNISASPVLGVVLGRDAGLHLDPHTPTSMGAPSGWEAQHIVGHESPYAYYLWTPETPDARTQIAQALSGFSVQLVVWEPETPQFFLDEPVLQKDLRSIPFFVWLADGTCHTGNVQPDGL